MNEQKIVPPHLARRGMRQDGTFEQSDNDELDAAPEQKTAAPQENGRDQSRAVNVPKGSIDTAPVCAAAPTPSLPLTQEQIEIEHAKYLRYGNNWGMALCDQATTALDLKKAFVALKVLAGETIDARNAELTALQNAAPLCDEHKSRSGVRAGCVICNMIKLSSALSRIDYLCEGPNEMQVSGYDLHCDEDAVVKHVEAKLAATQKALQQVKITLVELANAKLTEDNCASFDVANRRIHNLANTALAALNAIKEKK